jgi:hypothetical protein
MNILLFIKSGCSACNKLKSYLDAQNVSYVTVSGDTASGQVFMRTNGVFLAYYPALCVNGRMYEYAALFSEKGELMDLGVILG